MNIVVNQIKKDNKIWLELTKAKATWNLLLYKSHYVYLKGKKPTPPTVLNVENSKLAISNGYTIPHDVRYFMFLKSKY